MTEIPDKLVNEIRSRKQREVFLIAIDGCGGAGKSTLAEDLASVLNRQVVHIDDFYKTKEKRVEITERTPVHSNFEFGRLKQEVLQPLGSLVVANYHSNNGGSLEIHPNGYVIIEGLGTLGLELKDYFDYKIWVDSPEAIRRQRGILRDTEEWTRIWDEEYLPQDARYVREQSPQSQADWILSNS